MSTPTVETISAAEPRASVWEDLIDVLYMPGAVFRRRAEHPAGFVLPLLALTVVMGVLFYAMQHSLAPMFDAEFQRGMAAAMRKNPDLTIEQMQGMRAMSEKFGLIGFALMFPVGVLVLGLVLWGVGKLFGAVASVGAMMLVATYAQMPRLIQQTLSVLQGFVLSAESLTSRFAIGFSPARFLDPDATAPVVLALLERFDLFTLWVTFLLALGLHFVGRVPRAQAYLAAALVWLLGALPAIVGALSAS
jgi:hypothetical protein